MRQLGNGEGGIKGVNRTNWNGEDHTCVWKLLSDFNYLKKNWHQKKKVTGTTGMVPTRIGGTALHGFFGLIDGRHTVKVERVVWQGRLWQKTPKHSQHQCLIVDEIFMLSMHTFNPHQSSVHACPEKLCIFWVGVKLLFAGNFYRLHVLPISSAFGDTGEYCFMSESWPLVFNYMFELKHVFRQTGCMRFQGKRFRGNV